MQHASEQIATQSGTPDVNDAAAREILGDHVAHPSARLVVEAVQHFIDKKPRRRVNDGPRKCQTLLLSVDQDTLPASGLIEHRHQAIQAEPLERMRERLGSEVRDRQGVSENLAQRAGG